VWSLLLAGVAGCFGAQVIVEAEGTEGGTGSGQGGTGATTTSGTEGGGDTSASTTSNGATGGSGTTTSDAGSSSSSASESDTDTGGAFIQEPDNGVSPLECDVWEQDCPDGEKCTPWYSVDSVEGTLCWPLAPEPHGIYEPCQVEPGYHFGPDDCGWALLCVGVHPDTEYGYCIGLCRDGETPQDPVCEDPTAWCYPTNGPWSDCRPACNPLANDCPWQTVCAPHGSPDGFACSPAPSSPDGNGDPCDPSPQSCEAGLYCAPGSDVPGCQDDACCTEYCSLGSPTCSLPGVECPPFYDPDPAPEGLEDLGACLLP
jgi:hypothetical protein